MYTFILLSLFFLPMFNAIRYETELDSNEELFVPHSAAANYLFDLPIQQESNSAIDRSLLSDQYNLPQERAKRIYWENLAFHAMDFNRKNKKFKKN